MQGSKKIPIIDLNQHITCKICNGYFVDATTIIECLHTFCRSCIVKYLENNKYCPVCDVQVHKTKPLLNIRPDKTIQDIVYKLVPRLFQNEMHRRREFYGNHPEAKPSSLEMCGEAAYQYLLTPEESVCLTLNYHGSNGTPRYLRCPAAVSLGHLKKLIRAKYDLTDSHRVEILYNQDCLSSSLTLMDVAYIYMWKRKGPIELTYRIYECSAKKLKLEPEQAESLQNPSTAATNNNNWKEVQLRISETGEMSITGIQDAALSPSILEIVNSDPQKYKNEIVTVVEAKSPSNKSVSPKKELPGLKYIGKNVPKNLNSNVESNDDALASVSLDNVAGCKSLDILRLETSSVDVTAPSFMSSCATLSSGTTTMVFSTINSSKCSTKSDEPVSKSEPLKSDPVTAKDDFTETANSESPKSPLAVNNVADKSFKRKSEGVLEAEPPIKQSKPTILNHSLGLLNLSNNHPLKKHSKLNRNGENVKEIVLRGSVPALEPPVTSPPVTPTTKPPTPTIKTVTTTTTTDTTFSKPSPINKNLTVASQPNRPGTPITTTKPSIMTAKPPIIPPKPSVSVYGGTVKSPCYMPKTAYNPILNVLKSVTSTSVTKSESKPSNVVIKSDVKVASGPSMPKIDGKAGNVASSQQPQQQMVNLNNKMGIKSKPSSPIGYKTLRDPPKSWNSQISKANLSKPPPDPKYSELKNVRPAKFFKMRNNMPRYLGNPASGVKPMYQVHVSPEKEKSQEPNKAEKSEIRKHSIVKIDPKTLKPISEKAPETTSLSNHSSSNHNLASQAYQTHQTMNNSGINQSLSNSGLGMGGPGQGDLKINTSSVSIFNPLKLQSSPKNERKSPKSPHSPKLKAQATSSPTGNKRDKVNLNFTPPNPFVPNLTSPTMSPNQFLYPTGPPGFPPYDPRMMAAYHSLWYGQRMGFPASPMPRLSLDLNQQRKNFEMMPSPTSPKMAGVNQQGHSPQISTKMTLTTSSSISSASKTQSLLPHVAPPKPNVPTKKTPKESKNEKSLETTVEKLTQNRNKEMSGKNESSALGKAENAAKQKSATKRLASSEGHKEKEAVLRETHRTDSKTKKTEESGSLPLPPTSSSVTSSSSSATSSSSSANASSSATSSSSAMVPMAPVESCPEKVRGEKTSEEGKGQTVSERVPQEREKVNVSTESKDSAKQSACAGKTEEAGSVRSKDLSSSVNNVKSSEEVVDGGK